MDAFCWTHAINMSLGSQIVQIKRSLEVAREYYEDHRHARFEDSTGTDSTNTV